MTKAQDRRLNEGDPISDKKKQLVEPEKYGNKTKKLREMPGWGKVQCRCGFLMGFGITNTWRSMDKFGFQCLPCHEKFIADYTESEKKWAAARKK